ENPDFWCKPAGYSRTPTCPSDLWDASLNACWGPCKYYTMKLGQSAAGNNGSALCCDATNVSSEPNIPTSWCNPSDPGHADIVGGYKCSPYDWADGYTENTLGCAKGDKYDRRQNLVSCAHGRWADLVDTNWPNMAAQSLEFIKNVNTGAPGAYAWQFDDLKSSYKCRKTDGVVNYTVTFCPGGGATTYALQTSRNGTGAGAVTSSPAGVNCGSTCNATFSAGTVVTLTATAAAGSTFTGWSGGGCSGTGTCAVTMNGNISVTAGFTAATTCTYTIGPRVRTVAYRGGTAPVSITARGASVCPAPTVDVMEGDAYITYSNLTFNKTRGSVKVTVSQNTASATRAGSVYIGGAILPVTQTGKPCSYTISPPTSPIIAKAGGSDSFTLTMSPTDCGWTAQSGAPWITVTSASSGTGSGTVFYTAAENTGRPARSGKVNVALSTGKMKKAHTVRQTNR
ncbi:MAG TPA: BACON domain-containing protein, partial [Syntrophorhabdaceae bacterium]